SDKGKRLDYGNQSFRTLRGQGFKSNYYDSATHEEYWISGCDRDGRDALHSTDVEIYDDALEEYWVNIRRQPSNKGIEYFTARSKY
ncbi:MAG: 1-deoxy-D-xylulose-5-phosphate synthase, partial [Pyrinomonadaceae bacterium]